MIREAPQLAATSAFTRTRSNTQEARHESITFRGFTEAQKKYLSGLITILGLPLNYIQEIQLKKLPPLMGEGTLGQYVKGKIIIYESTIYDIKRQSNAARFETFLRFQLPSMLVHEFAHAQSAVSTNAMYDRENRTTFIEKMQRTQLTKGYGETLFSEEEAQHFAAQVDQIAEQSLKTSTHFSPYHVMNTEMYQNTAAREAFSSLGLDIEDGMRSKLNNELEAILVQMYFEDPKKLLQVEESQRRKLSSEELAEYISPTEFVESLLMHTTQRTIDDLRIASYKYKDYIHENQFPF